MVPLGFESGENQFQLERRYFPNDRKSHSAPQGRSNLGNYEDCYEITKNVKRKKSTFWKEFRGTFFGHAPNITKLIDESEHRAFLYISLSIIESIFRSISNIILISNPFSGLVILCTMAASSPTAVILGMASLISGILCSLYLVRLPIEIIRGGSVTLNCFLLGSLIPPLVNENELTEVAKLIPISVAAGIFLIFCWGGLDGLFRFANIPVLNAPCNILALLFLYSGLASYLKRPGELVGDGYFFPHNSTPSDPIGNFNDLKINIGDRNNTIAITERTVWKHENDMEANRNTISYYEIINGIVLAQGQIYQTNSVLTSSVVYLSVLIYSPILFFQQLMGATIGSLIGIGLSQPPYKDLYNGGWAYNSLLTASGIGGFFIALNFQSWILSLIASIMSTLIYSGLINSGIPALGIPFMITIWLLLPMTKSIANLDYEEDKEDNCLKLYRVSDFTTPEINRRCCKHEWILDLTSDDKYRRPNKSTVLPL